MALSKDRIFKAADAYVRAGKLEKAVTEYEKWVAANPKDWNTIRQIGDLYARIGRNAEAIKKYSQIAEYYRTDGFNVRAIATYKMILRLDPQNEAAMRNLADLQAEQGLLMEAKSQFQALVELYTKSGSKRRAAEVFKKLAEIDPADLKVRYKYAEFLERQGDVDEAVSEYVGIADEFINNGKVSEAIQIMEKGLPIAPHHRQLRCKLAQAASLQGDYARAVQLLEEVRQRYAKDLELLTRLGEAHMGAGNPAEAEVVLREVMSLAPDKPEHTARLAELAASQGKADEALELLTPVVDGLLGAGEGDKATAMLQKLLGRQPGHVNSLLKLAEIYAILKQESGRISAYDQLCDAYAQQGEFEKAVSVAEQLVELEPENSQHRDRLRFLKSRLGGPAPPATPAPTPPSPSVESEVNLPDLEDIESAMDFGEAVSATFESDFQEEESSPAEVAEVDEVLEDEAVPTLTPEDEEHIKEKLTEAEVFVRYGLVDKAIEQLKDLLESFRYHTESREKLVEIYKDQGMNREAAEQIVQLARVYQRLGDTDRVEALRKEARLLNPAMEESSPGAAEEEIELTLAPEADSELGDMDALLPEESEFLAAGEAPDFVIEEEPVAEEVPAVSGGASGGVLDRTEEELEVDLEGMEDIAVEVELGGENAEGEDVGPALDEPVPEGAFGESVSGGEEAPEFEVEESFEVDAGFEEIPSEAESPAVPPSEELLGAGEPGEFEIDLGGVGELEPELDADATVEDIGSAAAAEEEEVSVHFGEEAALIDEEIADEAPIELEEPLGEEESEPAHPAVSVATPAAPTAPEAPPTAPASRVSAELVEVDEYIALGLYEDAKDTLRELVKRYPEDAALLAKIEELGFSVPQLKKDTAGAAPSGVPPAAEPRPAPAAEESFPAIEIAQEELQPFLENESEPAGALLGGAAPGDSGAGESFLDLASELSQEMFGTQSVEEESSLEPEPEGPLTDPGLEEIFREFKRGVEKQLGTEDYDTRYNLGIAYKEMGLLDEAIAEFQLAAKDESRLLECCSMLGLCFNEKGMPEIAIKWFEKGLQAPGRSEEEYHGLRYDLAQAHEAMGESEKALDLYMEIYRVNARFRDVKERVRELQAAKK